MNAPAASLYERPDLYDLVLGDLAPAEVVAFYRGQASRFGGPVLELAAGTGRIAIPLAEAGVDISGLDLSPEMLDLAGRKAAARGLELPLIEGDMRDFDLGRRFRLIFIAAQSLCHLETAEEVAKCLACAGRHLEVDGRLIVELFNPSMALLSRDLEKRYPVERYREPLTDRTVIVEERVRYDSATQVNHLRWFFRRQGSTEEDVVILSMRMFFPQEIDLLLRVNGYTIEDKFGDFTGAPFASKSPKQIIVARCG